MTNHCNVFASWCHRTKPIKPGFNKQLFNLEGVRHKLIKGNVHASFTEIKGHPDLIKIRGINFKAEDEPRNGIYSADQGRALWALLAKNGYRKEG